ncbi:hypothetical protein KFK09_012212 [Dendrobium nobile]|uniref:Uncharacterized protein n=1 Tax=Dendrobium nobile TaxID=94219 RepID=A0A8T3BES4_DENNO|nr:hypothetical protein KFK09_012212 [Dendrobium nobile]
MLQLVDIGSFKLGLCHLKWSGSSHQDVQFDYKLVEIEICIILNLILQIFLFKYTSRFVPN